VRKLIEQCDLVVIQQCKGLVVQELQVTFAVDNLEIEGKVLDDIPGS
jgi:hypothetical protein